MKVRLLKRVRKEYEIIYYPNGFGYYSDSKIMVLFQNNDVKSYRDVNDKQTKKMAYDSLWSALKESILKKYKKYGTRRLKKNGEVEKLWYKFK